MHKFEGNLSPYKISKVDLDKTHKLDLAKLARMKEDFLNAFPLFKTFSEPGQDYLDSERLYKDELRELFIKELLPQLTKSEHDHAGIIPLTLDKILKAKLPGAENRPQNLIDWRTLTHFSKLPDVQAQQVGMLYKSLLNEEVGLAARLNAFADSYPQLIQGVVPLKDGGKMDSGTLRPLTSFILSSYDPERYIFVRTNILAQASERLTGVNICAAYSAKKSTLGEEYVQIMEFSHAVKDALSDWQPRDFIDVQSFLWVATRTRAEIIEPEFDDMHSRIMNSGRACFHVLLGEKSAHIDDCLNGNFIGADFGIEQDLTSALTEKFRPFGNKFITIYQDMNPEVDRRAAGLACGSLWIICKNILTGDIVFCPDAKGNYHICEVIGDYVYAPKKILPHRRPVRWLAHDIDKAKMSTELKKSMVFMCIASRIEGHNEEIEQILVQYIKPNHIGMLHDPGKHSLPFQNKLQSLPTPYQEPDFLTIQAAVNNAGMVLSERLLRRYHLSLKTRGFVILAGVSGTGKTWLAELYAKAVGAEYHIAQVAPNWTSNEDLLGYQNPVSNTFCPTGFTAFLKKACAAQEEADTAGLAAQPYHLILDEMNLARVEHYFARFLSAMELRQRGAVPSLDLGTEELLYLPENLIFIGTVNVDETTHGFADKVFDRAQLIELPLEREQLASHVSGQPFAEAIMATWDAVREAAPFAYRVLDDIGAYVAEAKGLGVPWKEALDEMVVQKVLPRIKGNNSRIDVVFASLEDVARQYEFSLTLEKIAYMRTCYHEHGFTSFFQ